MAIASKLCAECGVAGGHWILERACCAVRRCKRYAEAMLARAVCGVLVNVLLGLDNDAFL
jgi:hypothetical protein